MNITNIIVTKQATAQTNNANYQLEYSVSNGILTRVSASISEWDKNRNEVYLGNIFFDNGAINCTLQVNAKAARFFEDFEGFMTEIKADVLKQTSKNE
jgi:hypothetical protein